MEKIRIKLIVLGHALSDIRLNRVKKWKSKIIEIDEYIESFAIKGNSDGVGWEFSDDNMYNNLKNINRSCDFLIAITNVQLEDNYYMRRLKDGKIIFTFFEIKEYLQSENIPLENALIRIMYELSLVYMSHGNKILSFSEAISFTHDETRGCIFDMNGIKPELTESCHKPIICNDCQTNLRNKSVSNEFIKISEKEIRKIQKDLYYRISDFVKKYPALSIFISIILAIIINFISSALYEIAKLFIKIT